MWSFLMMGSPGPFMALFRHGPMSDLSPLSGAERTWGPSGRLLTRSGKSQAAELQPVLASVSGQVASMRLM
jgi:hypothetical protein